MSETLWESRRLRDAPGSVRCLRISFVTREHLRPPIQLFQPSSHFLPARQASHAVFTVWSVDSQKGHYVTDSTLHHTTHLGCVADHEFGPSHESRKISPALHKSDDDC